MSSTPNSINFPDKSQGIDREIFLEFFQRLSPSERRIWEVLCGFSKQFVSVFPSQTTIARLAKCTDRTVRRAISKFKSLNWVKITYRKYSSCVYSLRKELKNINTRQSTSFVKTKSSSDGNPEKKLTFVKAYQEKFSKKDRKIFSSIQKRSVFRTSFFSYRNIASASNSSVSSVLRFLKKFKKLIGFYLIKRGGMKSIFGIYPELEKLNLRDPKTFHLATYNRVKNTSSRADQVKTSKFMLRNTKLNARDLAIVSRFRPLSVAKAVEDLETYQARHKVKNKAAFLIARCKSHSVVR